MFYFNSDQAVIQAAYSVEHWEEPAGSRRRIERAKSGIYKARYRTHRNTRWRWLRCNRLWGRDGIRTIGETRESTEGRERKKKEYQKREK